MAIAVRGGVVAGVVFHTDQGGEYTGGELFATACTHAQVNNQSMGRTGSALDNAVARRAFHSTLEFELLPRGTLRHPGPGKWGSGRQATWRSTTPSGCIRPTA